MPPQLGTNSGLHSGRRWGKNTCWESIFLRMRRIWCRANNNVVNKSKTNQTMTVIFWKGKWLRSELPRVLCQSCASASQTTPGRAAWLHLSVLTLSMPYAVVDEGLRCNIDSHIFFVEHAPNANEYGNVWGHLPSSIEPNFRWFHPYI